MTARLECFVSAVGVEVIDVTTPADEWKRYLPGEQWVRLGGAVELMFYDQGEWRNGDTVLVTVERVQR